MLCVRKTSTGKAIVGVSAFVLFLQVEAAAAPIQIRVLNAKNAERVANQKVSVLIKGQRDATEYVTDTEGNINVDLDPSARIWVATEWWTTCRKTGKGIDPYVSVAQVVQEGVTVENNCGHATSETIKGKLIIFAKKSSFIQLYKK
jgi:hypothetical protein